MLFSKERSLVIRIFYLFYVEGEAACTINVHNTCKHITTGVRPVGPLWAFSCFGTEGWNGAMMKLIHGTHHVAIQVHVDFFMWNKYYLTVQETL